MPREHGESPRPGGASRALAIARFEIGYQLRMPLVWLVSLVLGLIAFGATSSDAIQLGGSIGNVLRNAPIVVVRMLLYCSVLAVYGAAGLLASAAQRDAELGTAPLFFTKPIRKADYVLGRFTGALLNSSLLFVGPILGILAAPHMPWVDTERVGPLVPEAFVYALVLFVLPNLLFTGALYFVLALLSRSILVTYLGVVVSFVGFLFSQTLLDDLDSTTPGALLDPFGISALELSTRYWTVIEQNTALPPVTGILLLNRLLWIALGLAALAWGLHRFEPSTDAGPGLLRRVGARLGRVLPGARRRALASADRAVAEEVSPITGRPSAGRPGATGPAPRTRPLRGAAATWRQFLRRTRFETAMIFRGVPFLVILGIGVLNLFGTAGFIDRMYGTSVLPETHLMLNVLENSYLFFLILVVTFYAGEAVWRERTQRLDGIVDAMPVANVALLGGKMAALALVVCSFIAAGVASTITLQLLRGYTEIDFVLYAKGFVLAALPFLFTMVLAVALQVLANGKFLGYLAMVLYLVGRFVAALIGVEHHLFRFGEAPAAPYSVMNGFGHFWTAVLWFDVYWAAASLVLGVVAALFWVRGRETAPRRRLAAARRRLHGPAAALLALGLVVFAGVGGWIYYNTNVLNEFRSSDASNALAAGYESRYRQYRDLTLPRVTAVDVEVDIFPHQRRIEAKGTYTLVNRSDAPLDALHLTQPIDGWVHSAVELPPHTVELDDTEHGYAIYRFDEPLAPGATMTLDFSVRVEPRGFVSRDSDTRIVHNGTFFNNRHYFPIVGYDASRQMIDRSDRREHGLGPVERMAPVDDPVARQFTYLGRGGDWIDFRATVSTSADQIALAPGYLQREETVSTPGGERRVFHYAMDAPILPFYAFLSADWQVSRDQWNDVALEVYHHPRHDTNVPRMLEAMKASLEYFSREFSPYQHRQLRIVEFPRYATFAQAFPNTVPFSESIGFIARLDDDPEAIDYVWYVTAHEVAHQWWAHQVIGADTKGSTMLSETLSQYAALMVMEDQYGRETMHRFLAHELDSYLRGRGQELVEEQPLVAVENQAYIHYRKGSLAMYALRDLIGAEAVNQALAAYIDEVAFQPPPFTVAPELVTHLRAATPPEHQDFVTDLFERITLFDNRAEAATWTRRDDGRYDVVLEASVRKLYADGAGVETEVPVDDWIDVGVYGAPGPDGERTVLYRTKHPVREAAPRFEVVVDSEPVRAGIDPDHLLVDRTRDDNLVRVVRAGAE
ncbi:MAG: M1 family aminopeptidase [Acidobacteriota bacterium]